MLNRVLSAAGPLRVAAQNAVEVARYGGLETGQEPAPHEVVGRGPHHRLRRYFPADASGRPILLIPPTLLVADVYDVTPESSAVRELHASGMDPWVLDFGSPAVEVGGMDRTLSDHTLAVEASIDQMVAETGRPVFVCGYSQGGLFAYQAVALRRSADVAGVATLGAPVDWHKVVSLPLPEELGAALLARLFGTIGHRAALPAWVAREGFRLMDPVKALRNQITFVSQLHDRDALLKREGQRRFIEVDGWVPWAGPAVVEFAEQIVAGNRMMVGGLIVDGRPVSLDDIRVPVLTLIGKTDEFARAGAVRAIAQAAPNADVTERIVDTGHFGLVVGSAARRVSWPTLSDWAAWVDGDRERPEDLVQGETDVAIEPLSRAGSDLRLVGSAASLGARSTWRAMRSLGDVARDGLDQLSRLGRLQQLEPKSRASLGLLLEEQQRRDPNEAFFLFEDRAYTRAQAESRTNTIVRALLRLGVRRGTRVGLLMTARPSAITAVAALNRIGAVTVLLRPSGAPRQELELYDVELVVTELELADLARTLERPIAALGLRRQGLEVPDDVVDLEAPSDGAQLPAWYEPNPGLARDLAFVLFTGADSSTRVHQYTNARWLTSALGTATAASLTARDTVFCTAPPSHPTGLLVGIGGSLAGGARLAFAETTDAARFWEEARRYGATVVVYTWSLMRGLLEGGSPGSRVRLLIGSGMPPALWRRTESELAPARVVEFWTTTGADAVLVNIGLGKPGCVGRPLPGSAEVQVVEADLESGRPVLDETGLAHPCDVDSPGLLLARVNPDVTAAGAPGVVRGVFEPGDAWADSGEIFRRDADGDLWRIDSVAALASRPESLGSPAQARDAVESLPAVDTAVAYRIGDRLVVACTLHDGSDLTGEDLSAAASTWEILSRPDVVRVVASIQHTALHRPEPGPLLDEGIPTSRARRPVFEIDVTTGHARKLAAARAR